MHGRRLRKLEGELEAKAARITLLEQGVATGHSALAAADACATAAAQAHRQELAALGGSLEDKARSCLPLHSLQSTAIVTDCVHSRQSEAARAPGGSTFASQLSWMCSLLQVTPP